MYDWTREEIAGLAPGATVVFDSSLVGRRSGRVEVAGWDASWGHVVLKGIGSATTLLIDPSTLRPPSLTWLRATAKKKLGADARVELTMSGRVAREVGVYSMREDGLERALFIGDTCREHAARWLASLPEVSL